MIFRARDNNTLPDDSLIRLNKFVSFLKVNLKFAFVPQAIIGAFRLLTSAVSKRRSLNYL